MIGNYKGFQSHLIAYNTFNFYIIPTNHLHFMAGFLKQHHNIDIRYVEPLTPTFVRVHLSVEHEVGFVEYLAYLRPVEVIVRVPERLTEHTKRDHQNYEEDDKLEQFTNLKQDAVTQTS